MTNEIIYIVGSDLETSSFYAEFDAEDKALDFAKRNLDKLPFVQKVVIEYDDLGNETDVQYIDIWDHTKEDSTEITVEEDDFFAFKDAPAEFVADDLVEAMEENEDMVECKECFELFPKADCTKVEIGYICPTCSCGHPCDEDEVDIILVADEDTFKVDFPEYEKFNCENDMTPAESDAEPISSEEVAEDPVETENDTISTPDEAIPFLVKDEEEAIAGYEKAAEVVEASGVENKEEILDTLDHIKEEEVEHIEELTDLVDTKDDEIIEVENDPVSNAEDVESEELVEHVNEEHPTIESDQELHGIDNAVVDCKVAKVITHSEDEKPLNCEMKDKPLEKPLTETLEDELKSLDNGDRVVVLDNGGRRLLIDNGGVDFRTEAEWNEFKQLCDEIGLKTTDDVKYFINSLDVKDGDFRRAIKDYRAELGADFAIVNEKLELEHGFSHIKSVAKLVHDEVVKYDKDVVVGTHKSGTAFYVISAKDKSDPKKMKELIIDILAKNHYEPERVEFLEKNSTYGYFIGDIKALATMTMSYQKKESLSENLYNFTEEEMKEFNMDEDGVSLDSYDEYVRCNWCGEVFTVDQCIFEANMGWLCDRCYQAILSRGEKLTIIKNPTDEDIARTLTEEVKMTVKELKDKFGTDDVDLINAGREPEERVELAEAVSGEIEMPFSDLSKEEQEYIKAFTKFINDAIANKTELTADDILKFKDNYSKNIVNKK